MGKFWVEMTKYRYNKRKMHNIHRSETLWSMHSWALHMGYATLFQFLWDAVYPSYAGTSAGMGAVLTVNTEIARLLT